MAQDTAEPIAGDESREAAAPIKPVEAEPAPTDSTDGDTLPTETALRELETEINELDQATKTKEGTGNQEFANAAAAVAHMTSGAVSEDVRYLTDALRKQSKATKALAEATRDQTAATTKVLASLTEAIQALTVTLNNRS